MQPWHHTVTQLRPLASNPLTQLGIHTRANSRRANQTQGVVMPGYTDSDRCATTSTWSLSNVIREPSPKTSRMRRWNVSSAMWSLSGE